MEKDFYVTLLQGKKMIQFLKNLFCYHNYLRRTDLDHLWDFGRNKRTIGFVVSAGKKRVKYYTNMREIKFRVWSFNEKTFHYFYVYEGFSGYYGSWSHPQEFTGLKDKNGREIYEGDILKIKSYDGWSDKTGFYYNSQVFYCSSLARFRHSFKNFDNMSGTDFELNEDAEVIGNIFENPELLE